MVTKINYTPIRRYCVLLLLLCVAPTLFSQTKQILSSTEVEMIAKSNVELEKQSFENVFTDFELVFDKNISKEVFEKHSQNFSSIALNASLLTFTVKKDDAYLVEKLIQDFETKGIKLKTRKSVDFRFI